MRIELFRNVTRSAYLWVETITVYNCMVYEIKNGVSY